MVVLPIMGIVSNPVYAANSRLTCSRSRHRMTEISLMG